jgi:hypothetical protein
MTNQESRSTYSSRSTLKGSRCVARLRRGCAGRPPPGSSGSRSSPPPRRAKRPRRRQAAIGARVTPGSGCRSIRPAYLRQRWLRSSLSAHSGVPVGQSAGGSLSGRRLVFLIFSRACRILVRAHGSLAPGTSCPGEIRIPLWRSRSGSASKLYRTARRCPTPRSCRFLPPYAAVQLVTPAVRALSPPLTQWRSGPSWALPFQPLRSASLTHGGMKSSCVPMELSPTAAIRAAYNVRRKGRDCPLLQSAP